SSGRDTSSRVARRRDRPFVRWMAFGGGRVYLAVFALPAVAYVAVWRIVPALYTLWLSLTEYNLVYDLAPRWTGWDNYARLLQDGALWEAIRISGLFALVATGLELAIALGAAAFFDSDPPGRNVLLGFFMLPMIMAPVVVGTAW